MAGLIILLLFVLPVVVVRPEPIRLRRQSINSVPCPIQCSVTMAQAWAKAISFQVPTANMIRTELSSNDTFGVMCTIYREYVNTCLQRCVASNAKYAAAVRAAPTYDQLCTNKQTEFDKALPCLVDNSKRIQGACQTENELLLAAAVRLNTPQSTDSNETSVFCETANKQAYCVFPVLRQLCGDKPYNLLRSILTAAVSIIRSSVGDKAISAFYPQCSDYFRTIETGVPPRVSPIDESAGSVWNVTNTADMETSPMASDNVSTDSTQRSDDTTGTYIDPDEVSPSLPSNAASPCRIDKLNILIAFSFIFLTVLL